MPNAPSTKHDWNEQGRYVCICTTPTHKKGQRFNSSQCSYCELYDGQDAPKTAR